VISPLILRKTYSVQRRTGQMVNGRWASTDSGATFSILASVQPLNAEERNAFTLDNQGRRPTRAVKIYTNADLVTGGTGQPDRIILDGKPYEIFAMNDWNCGLLTHNKYIAIMVEGV